jgi:chemotaxis protein methyltransferase CheR
MRAWGKLLPKARSLIASRLGLEFSEGRQADLERGLIHACQAASISDPEAYLGWLATLPEESPEWKRLAGHLTVGETYLFRDRACFEALEQHVFPSLVAARRREGALRLRIWSAGCATGEEPYSLAILLDRLLLDRADWALTILATDINLEALEAAERGCYRAWALRETPPWIRERYFHRRGAEIFELDPAIRRMVTFMPLNLAEDGYPTALTNTSAMDLILCRSVLMYFTREAQQATVARLRQALVAGGWLIVSPAEAAADLLRSLVPVNLPGAIFYRKEEPVAVSHQRSAFGHWPSAISTELLGESVTPVPETLSEAMPIVPPRPPSPDFRPPVPGPQSLLQRARALGDEGKLEEARRVCEAATAQDQLDPETHLLLAAICQEQGEIQVTMDALRRVIYLDPDSASAHFLVGSLLVQQGERARARRHLATALRLLRSVPQDEAVPGGEGLTAGRLLEMARMCLEMVDGGVQAPGTAPRLSSPR